VQSTGKIDVDVKKLDVDMLTLTAHKIYGPKGIGALFVKQGVRLNPLFHGGSHEKKRRPGTENIAGVVGFAKALEIALRRRETDYDRMKEQSEYFIEEVMAAIPDVSLNGSREKRLPHTVNLSFKGIEGESILLSLDLKGIAVSSGSACTSGATEPSHVLVAMGIDKVAAQGAIRFSIGRATTNDDLDYVIDTLPEAVNRLREMSPVYKK
jgi:cysteine desulfurase